MPFDDCFYGYEFAIFNESKPRLQGRCGVLEFIDKNLVDLIAFRRNIIG